MSQHQLVDEGETYLRSVLHMKVTLLNFNNSLRQVKTFYRIFFCLLLFFRIFTVLYVNGSQHLERGEPQSELNTNHFNF